MDNEKIRYQFKFELALIAAVVFLVIALMRGCEINALEDRVSTLESGLSESYLDGYNDGYDAGYSSGVDHYFENERNREISKMSVDEILDHLNNVTGECYWSNGEVYNVFIYAFQRGYENRANGVWDNMTQEFIDGYIFSSSDIEKYSIFEWE